MSDLNNILREEYSKKNNTITPQSLIKMIDEMMDTITNSSPGYTILSEREAAQQAAAVTGDVSSDEVTVIRRPTIKITELWGKTENGDREIMESLMNNIGGSTIQEKVKSVKDFLEAQAPPPGEGEISKIMSYLIFLDTFASIINDYGASVSGFLFEAFLAALMGGTSIQIDDPQQVGAAAGSLPIEDVQLAIRRGEEAAPEIVPYSLKVLRKNGAVHGSFKNIVDYFLDPAERRKTDSIIYLIVIKDADKNPESSSGFGDWNGKLKFYEFEITRANFMQLIGTPTPVPIYDYLPVTITRASRQTTEKKPAHIRDWPRFKTIDGGEIADGTVIPKGTEVLRIQNTGRTENVIKGSAAKLYSPEQYTAVTGRFADAPDIDRQVFAALQDTKGYRTEKQWSIGHGVYTQRQYWKGDINLDPEVLKARAEDYTQSLNASIVAIFNALGDLSENINSYFIGAKDQNRKEIGTLAKENADTLKREVNLTIKT